MNPSSATLPLTILIPTFNHCAFLNRTLQSVLAQDGVDGIQVVISDDHSSDDSFEVASKIIGERPNFLLRRNSENLGIHRHYLQLLSLVKTEFVCILEGDDFIQSSERSRELLKALSQRTDMSAVFGGYSLVDESDALIESRQTLRSRSKFQSLYFEELLVNNPIGSFSNCMYKTAVLSAVLGSEAAELGYDWVVNLLIADKSPIGFLPGYFTNYRIHKNGSWTQLSEAERHRAIAKTLEGLAEYLSHKNSLLCRNYLRSMTSETA
jgi:glycosyltransferase involved in cell wall biosynthesis